MQKLVRRLQSELHGFIEQRDELVMVASCSDNDVAILLKILRDIEQASGTDVFLLFADDFVAPGPYVSVAAERLREEHRIACEALAQDGKPALPPIPDEVFDVSREPVERLWRAICFAQSLLPPTGGHRLVWAMCPLRIADRREYLKMMSAFIPRHGIEPWMRRLRMICRDGMQSVDFAPGLAQAPRTRVVPFDFGPAAIEQSMTEEVEDEQAPLEQRMQALLMLASVDQAHGRNAEALTKYNTLLGHYQSTNNLPMQAFVLNAFGDMYLRTGALDSAQHWYECAVPPAMSSKQPVIMATVVRNLGDVAFQKGQFADAEKFYEGVDQLATHSLDFETAVKALEWKGLSQERQGRYADAVVAWEAAAEVSRTVWLPGLLKQVLAHLERGYTALGDRDKAAAARAAMVDVDREEVTA
jgi:hypothetical protein